MQRIVEDLYNDEIDLFIPCPNAQHDINLNRHIFLPNPKYAKGKAGRGVKATDEGAEI